MKKIAIIHFQPIELYPPIQNIVDILSESGKKKVFIFTTKQFQFQKFEPRIQKNIIIYRFNISSNNRLFRFIKYVLFYVFTLGLMLVKSPTKVIYFESISALPAIIYKKIKRTVTLFVHYHEYTSLSEYQNGMLINRLNYFIERRNYDLYFWISHTNSKRLELFKNDNNLSTKLNLRILPNYPNRQWIENAQSSFSKDDSWKNSKIKLVYIGPLDFNTTYIQEITDFVKKNNQSYSLDIYSMNYKKDVYQFLNTNSSSAIQFKGSLVYNLIPKILASYQIGLILYKGTVLNFVHNAPNKLFEYLNCGLDIWYPEEMIGCRAYDQIEYPTIKQINFNDIERSLQDYTFKGKKLPKESFSAENATLGLIQTLCN